MDNFASGIAENNFFEKWIILYDIPIFKLIMAIAILRIIYVLIKTVFIGLKEKNTKLNLAIGRKNGRRLAHFYL